MKKKELKSLRIKKNEDLAKMVADKKKEATETYAKMRAGKEKNLKRVKYLKKEIAQILTIMKEKEFSEEEKKKEEPKKETKKETK